MQVSENASLHKRLQELQAQIAALTMAITSKNGSGVAPSSPADIVEAGSTVAHRGTTESRTATAMVATSEDPACEPAAAPSEVTGPCEQEQMVTSSTPSQHVLKLGNGTILCFSKESVPDPPAYSFAKGIPQLMKVWDDSSAEWDPTEVRLRIQGQPIALKHWPDVYRYGKEGQWKGTKKNWTNWQVSFHPHSLLWHDTYHKLWPAHCYELAKAHRARILAEVFL